MFTIYWEVDGASGSATGFKSRDEAYYEFQTKYAPFGYTLVRIAGAY